MVLKGPKEDTLKKFLLVIVALAALAVPAGANVIDFDDLSLADTALPPTYAGLEWGPSWYSSGIDYGPDYDPFSPPIRVYTTPAGGWVKWPGLTTFLGAAVSTGDPGQVFWFEGYLGGSKLFESAHNAGAFRGFVGLNWPIDEIRFLAATPYAVLDDITYCAVPAPPSILLLASGDCRQAAI